MNYTLRNQLKLSEKVNNNNIWLPLEASDWALSWTLFMVPKMNLQ